MRLTQRMRDLEAAAADSSKDDDRMRDTPKNDLDGMQQSSETIKSYIKNFNHGDKLDFT